MSSYVPNMASRQTALTNSGGTRGLNQGRQNLAEGGPLATVWVRNNLFTKTHIRYSTKAENSFQVI